MPLHIGHWSGFNHAMDWIPSSLWFMGKTFFLIFVIGIYLPQVVFSAQNIFYGQYCRHHGMILIVILVHSITANQLKIGKGFEEPAQGFQ